MKFTYNMKLQLQRERNSYISFLILFCTVLFQLHCVEIKKNVDLQSIPDDVIIHYVIPNVIPNIVTKLSLINTNSIDNEYDDCRHLYNPKLLFTSSDLKNCMTIQLINKKLYKNLHVLHTLLFQLTNVIKDVSKKYLFSDVFTINHRQLLKQPVTINFQNSNSDKKEVAMWIERDTGSSEIKFCFKFRFDKEFSLIPITITWNACKVQSGFTVSEEVRKYFDLLNTAISTLRGYSKNSSDETNDNAKGYRETFLHIPINESTEISPSEAMLLYTLIQAFFLLQKNIIN